LFDAPAYKLKYAIGAGDKGEQGSDRAEGRGEPGAGLAAVLLLAWIAEHPRLVKYGAPVALGVRSEPVFPRRPCNEAVSDLVMRPRNLSRSPVQDPV